MILSDSQEDCYREIFYAALYLQAGPNPSHLPYDVLQVKVTPKKFTSSVCNKHSNVGGFH